MSKNLIKSAYTKGYKAGRRRAQHDQDIRREQDFLEHAYLAALPVVLSASGWTLDDKSITSGNDRNRLAGLWADAALRERRKRI